MSQRLDTLQRTTAQDRVYREALDRFERCLVAPHVPGELLLWLDAVEEAFESAEAAWGERTRYIHPDLFAQILQLDMELRHRVDQMKREDVEILDALHDFEQALLPLRRGSEKLEANEAAVLPALTALADRGAKLILRVRKQEVALESWFLEAFNRENGSGD